MSSDRADNQRGQAILGRNFGAGNQRKEALSEGLRKQLCIKSRTKIYR